MKKTIYTLIVVLIACSSCSHYYYVPNSPNVPVLREKNDMRISAGYSGGETFEGAELQFAYAVAPHVGIMVNGLTGGKTEEDENNQKQSGKGSYGEIGAGYFLPFSPKKLFVFEIYGGAGTGVTNHEYGTYATSKVGVTKLFIQPSISYAAKKGRFEFAMGSRFSSINVKVKDASLVTDGQYDSYATDLEYVREHANSVLWEPSIRISMGSKDVKFYFSYVHSFNLSNSLLPQELYTASMGLRLTLNTGKK
ncbi:MAG: hypothetical protein JST75_19965 [Bacteroidetes bacterium]|nr:hypothetical protein [Bacteroidota bacterium]